MNAHAVPQFTDSDVVNIDDYIPAGEYNPHNVRPCVFLGNNDKPFDIDCLDAIELPNPPMSFRALWDAMK